MNYRNNNKKRRSAAITVITLLLIATAGVLAARSAVHWLYPMEYREYVEQSCEEFGVDPLLVYAVIHTESGFDPEARSEAGAMGLMQIMPDTFEWLQGRLNMRTGAQEHFSAQALYQPQINIRYGVFYLSLLMEQFGDEVLSVAAYHAGQNRVSGWVSERKIPPVGCVAEEIPSSATGHYVRKVMNARTVYERLYG